MALPSTLYRFKIELSDVDRGVYENLDLRVSMHPSETAAYLLTRTIAFALNARPGLEFAPGGLSDPDQAAIQAPSDRGGVSLWIEIGNPSPRKLHKASKAAEELKVYTYKAPESLLKEIRANTVHNAGEIAIYSFEPKFLDGLAATLVRDNRWNLVVSDGSLTLSSGEKTFQTELLRHQV